MPELILALRHKQDPIAIVKSETTLESTFFSVAAIQEIEEAGSPKGYREDRGVRIIHNLPVLMEGQIMITVEVPYHEAPIKVSFEGSIDSLQEG